MTILKLEKTAWSGYFDQVSKALEGKRAEIEIASLGIGSQIEAKWLPLLGITYEAKTGLLELALENLDHMIQSPKEIYIDQNPGGLTSMEIIDRDGVHQTVQLRDPLRLPAPG